MKTEHEDTKWITMSMVYTWHSEKLTDRIARILSTNCMYKIRIWMNVEDSTHISYII